MGSMIKMGVYDKEPLSCNGHSDENISEFVKKHIKELLSIYTCTSL